MKRPLNKNEIRSQKIFSRTSYLTLQKNPIFIVLDNLKCSHNVGTIIRIADALLVNKVFICGDIFFKPNKKIKKSSRGSEKWVYCEYRSDIIEVINDLKKSGVYIISVEISNTSIDFSGAEYKFPACLVFGSEENGVCEEVLNISDCIVHLPIYGMTNSLNVATTASVVLYSIVNQIEKYDF